MFLTGIALIIGGLVAEAISYAMRINHGAGFVCAGVGLGLCVIGLVRY